MKLWLGWGTHFISDLTDPAEDAEGSERVPAARLAGGLASRDGDGFVVSAVEEPSAVGLAFALKDVDRVAETRVD